MQIETGRMDVFAAVRKLHGDMSFVRALVGRKPGVAVDAEKRSSRRPGIAHQIRSDLVQGRCEIGDEADRGFVGYSLILFLVRLKPFAIVVALEPDKKSKQIGSEVRRHGESKVRAEGK